MVQTMILWFVIWIQQLNWNYHMNGLSNYKEGDWKMKNHKELLLSFSACREAVDWYNDKDSQEAWESCNRGDWMLWIAARLEIDKKLIVLAACNCAELSLQFVPNNENRPKEAVEAARRWVIDPTEENRLAADAAADAADAAA